MGQMMVEAGASARNLERAEEMIREAGGSGCEMIVLPECLDFGWMDDSAGTQAWPIPGEASDRLCAAARDARIHVVAGLNERDGKQLYNSAVLISPEGVILHRHRKINELDFARAIYTTGQSLQVVQTSLGPVAVAICADLLGSSVLLGHALGQMGARLLLCPCAWAVAPDHDNSIDPYGGNWVRSYTELASRWNMAVAGVTNVGRISSGPWRGHKCIGCSLAVGPGGTVLAQGPYGEHSEALLIVELASVHSNRFGGGGDAHCRRGARGSPMPAVPKRLDG